MTPAPAGFTPPTPEQPCPCGGGKPFAGCCRPLLMQERAAETPEQLMRSRFTAHVARDFAHLHRTHLESSREPYVPDPGAGGTNWTRLVVHSAGPGARPDLGFVDFTAFYKEGEEEKALHEKAEFERIEGTWFYTRAVRQGPAPVRSAPAAAGRNDPCPCGSGKKYKKCCMA